MEIQKKMHAAARHAIHIKCNTKLPTPCYEFKRSAKEAVKEGEEGGIERVVRKDVIVCDHLIFLSLLRHKSKRSKMLE